MTEEEKKGETEIDERVAVVEKGLSRIYWVEKIIDVYEGIAETVDNIRPRNEDHVQELADNISEIGQLQPCLCDPAGPDFPLDTVRLIAGQHRRFAVEELCQRGEYTKLLIREASRRLTPEEVLSVQMSENLQHPMTPAQDAVVIHALWEKAREIYGPGIKPKFLKGKIGRTEAKINNAIHFVEDVSQYVQMMVDSETLPYMTALALSKIKRDPRDGNWDEQLRLAVFFVSEKYTVGKAKEYIAKRIGPKTKKETYQGTLFDSNAWKKTERPIDETVKIRANTEGTSAVNWFGTMQKVIENLPSNKKVLFTEAVTGAFKEVHSTYKNLLGSAKGKASQRTLDGLTGGENS